MSAKKSSSLGRGFDTLLPSNFDDTFLLSPADKIEKITVTKLIPNRHQPRMEFNDEAITQLANSIKQYGILQPLVVTIVENGQYMIIAGERRWRAARQAGLSKVPAIVRTTKDLEQLEIALIENVQRVDLSPLEQAASIEHLHQKFGVNYEEIGKRLGKATSTVHNVVRLLQLPPEVQQALQNNLITEGHARAVLALKAFPDQQTALFENIQKYGWSVRQAEQFVVSHKEGFRDTKAAKERMKMETTETKSLSKQLKAPVSIRRTAHGGRIEVTFKSDDQLEKIMKFLLS